ncbi:MAG: glycogen/starch synthase [Flavobacteriaceae bacterium]
MQNKKVLIISSEVIPYLPQTERSINSFKIPKQINDAGGQTRIFMPRYGLINERRHQLHEVIRLSGMNLVINDMDMPLIIKVASIPKERMQVYFIDNEEYFKRKGMLHDADDQLFSDNDERMIFFTKGVIETVKKLNWSPDIIHLHGWFTALFPLYMKTYFSQDPIFEHSKIVTSIYPNDLNNTLDTALKDKIAFDQIDADLSPLSSPGFDELMQMAIEHSDGLILAGEEVSEDLIKKIKESDKPTLSFAESKAEESHVNFFNTHFL